VVIRGRWLLANILGAPPPPPPPDVPALKVQSGDPADHITACHFPVEEAEQLAREKTTTQMRLSRISVRSL
jgi:hypothetical protein